MNEILYVILTPIDEFLKKKTFMNVVNNARLQESRENTKTNIWNQDRGKGR